MSSYINIHASFCPGLEAFPNRLHNDHLIGGKRKMQVCKFFFIINNNNVIIKSQGPRVELDLMAESHFPTSHGEEHLLGFPWR